MKMLTATGKKYKRAMLYNKTENGIRISIVLTTRSEIKTYWLVINKERIQKWHKNRLKEKHNILDSLKINGCAICGYNICNEALEFHHTISKNKKFLLHVDSMSKNDKIITKELNKCILLCANCHKEIRAKERLNK